jgi:hypothetical protein
MAADPESIAIADHRRQPLDIGEARPVRLDQGN